MQDHDRLSEASFGSTISLHSIGSDGGFSPKPPSGSRKLKKNHGRTTKVKAQGSADSPYSNRRAVTSNKKTGRELWVNSIRQGIGMSNESSGMNTWNGVKAPHSSQTKAMASTSAYLLDQLLQSTGRTPKNHNRSASYTSIRVGGNGPAYKTAEEYYDEVIELKKRINTLMKENDLLKSKMHKVEEDNIAKARQIEELINPNVQTNEIRRTLTDKRQDSSVVVKSLKHKLHSMERVVRSKDNELSKIKNDLKFTDTNELLLQIDIYQEEIYRLNVLLTEPQSSNALQITSDIKKEKSTEGKLKKYNEAVQTLSDDNNRLLMENRTLKQDVRKAMELNANSLNLSKDVEDMNRTELLAKISELEQRLKEEEAQQKDPETPRTKRPPSQHNKYPGKAGEEIRRLEERETELTEELEKQKSTIKKLKEDRTHYRKLADDYRIELEKYKQLGNANEKSQLDETKARSNSVTSTASSKKPSTKDSIAPKKESLAQSKRDAIERRKESSAARTIQRNWRKHKEYRVQREHSLERKRADIYEEAIMSIQAAFRSHNARCELVRNEPCDRDDIYDYDDDDASSWCEDDVILMQAAFRGHKSRQQILKKEESSKYTFSNEDSFEGPPRFRRSFDTGEPIRDRLTGLRSQRASNGGGAEREGTSRSALNRDISVRSSRNSNRYGIYDDNDESDEDDDVVIGSSTSLNSDDRFEQSYLSKFKSDLNDSERYSQSRMSTIKEKDERQQNDKNTLKKLQRNSVSWDGVRKSSIKDFLSESEDDDVMITSKKKSSKKDTLKTKKASSNSQTDKKESLRLANKWASSGTQNNASFKRQEKPLISSRFSSSQWTQLSKDDDDSDDDDLVISPAISRQTQQKKKELEDELY